MPRDATAASASAGLVMSSLAASRSSAFVTASGLRPVATTAIARRQRNPRDIDPMPRPASVMSQTFLPVTVISMERLASLKRTSSIGCARPMRTPAERHTSDQVAGSHRRQGSTLRWFWSGREESNRP